jgi:phosphodiesterase/alkaline phosphatase D-like protein
MMKFSSSLSCFFKLTLFIFVFLALSRLGYAGDAFLSWDANTEPDLAGYKVYVGTASRTYSPPMDVGNQTSYTVTGLGLGTYFFAVTAYDFGGNESPYSIEVNKSFGDITPPAISSISAVNMGSSSVDIVWATNEGATSQVDYGVTTNYGSSTPINSNLTTNHSRSLSNLTPSTTYHYRVVSQDVAGNMAISGDNTFITLNPPDTTPPAISNISSLSISNNGATITWVTNEPSSTQIEYGTSSAYGSTTSLINTLVTSHSQDLSGLLPSTVYHFRVLSRDNVGNLGNSGDNTFTTTSPPDTTPPVISSITEGSVTSTNATITWNTDEDATSQVEYGTTTAYGSTSALNSTPVTSHSRALSGLTSSTTYHYRVLSRDGAGNLATSADNTFSTLAAPDITPPVISSIAEGSVTSTSVSISWKTDEGATSQVEYGTTMSYGSTSALNSTLVTSHSRSLSGLTSSTTYHYRVISSDAAGNLATSADNTFTTLPAPDTTPPVISGLTASNISSSASVITWSTNEGATSQVEYGTTMSYGSTSALNSTPVTSHSRSLSGLTSSNTYHYRVRSIDAAGNQAVSGDNTFTTSPLPDTTPPVISSINEGSVTSTSATITWNTGEGATSQVEYGTTTAYGSTSALNSTLVTSHSRSLSGLTSSTTYHYRVRSMDAAGNQAVSADKTFTTSPPPDTITPSISGINTSNITGSGAIVNWSTNEGATSQVEFGLTSAYGFISNLDSSLKTSHQVTLSGLSSLKTYHFRIRTMDAMGNLSVSNDGTFNTLSLPDQTPPVISNINTTSLSNTTILITWVTNEAATSQIEYGQTTNYENTTPFNATMMLDHSMTINGLTPDFPYHFRVRSLDTAGNLSVSLDQIFKTPKAPDQIPPGQIKKFSAFENDQEILLTWTSPSDPDYIGTRIVFKTTGGFPENVNDGQLLGDFTGVPNEVQSTIHTGLQNGTTYYYSAFSYDGQGNYQTNPVTVQGTPQPGSGGSNTPPPTVSSQSGGSAISDMGSAVGGCGFVKDARHNQNRDVDIAMFIVPFLMGLRFLFQKWEKRKIFHMRPLVGNI